MKKDKKNEQEVLDAITLRSDNTENIHSDVLGSYTGVPEDGGRPIQDADDL